MTEHKLLSLLALSSVLATLVLSAPLRSTAQGSRTFAEGSRTFPETDQKVSGRFLDYWDDNGGLAQQGFPISEEMEETSDTDGETYTVQYFERAVFEMHPENDAPYDVLLSLLGTTIYNEKYNGNAPGQKASTTNPRKFAETGKTVGGVFRKYWEQHGGLAQQGYPISNEFQEKSATDGKTYTVQYFERAVFERHPEKAGTQYEVQLSLLGNFFYGSKYGGVPTGPSLVPRVTPTPTTIPGTKLAESDVVKTGWTNIVANTNNVLLFYNAADGSGATARINNSGVLTPLRKFPGDNPGFDNLDKEASQLAPGPRHSLLLYREKYTDGVVYDVRNDGTIFAYTEGKSYAKWSIVQTDPESRVSVFYSNLSHQLATVEWSEGSLGSFATLMPGCPKTPMCPNGSRSYLLGMGTGF